MARTFVFDCRGTLIGNPAVSEDDMVKVIKVLQEAGHCVVVWSASVTMIPEKFAALADQCWSKELEFMDKLDHTCIVFDDADSFLESLVPRGCTVVRAADMGDWLVNEVYCIERADPVTNMNLPADRSQQAQRVRNTYRKLNTRKSKAVLKQYLKHRGEISKLARQFPMNQIYQVHPLALHEVTYAGAIGFVMSYLENGNMTFSVFYDRPGHRYTPVSARAEIEPAWIKAISLDEFEEEVFKKDNPTVLLA